MLELGGDVIGTLLQYSVAHIQAGFDTREVGVAWTRHITSTAGLNASVHVQRKRRSTQPLLIGTLGRGERKILKISGVHLSVCYARDITYMYLPDTTMTSVQSTTTGMQATFLPLF